MQNYSINPNTKPMRAQKYLYSYLKVIDMQNARSTVSCYFQLLRFDSWIGWLFNFALGSILFEIPPINRFASFSLIFILITAAIFVLNQCFDYESDKLNDLKRNLPISSGNVSPKTAIIVFFLLTVLSMCFALLTDINILLLFLAYLGLWICYSTPPFRLKSRPITDVIVAGVGSGVLPFVIGLQVSNRLTLDFSSFWIRRHYQDAFFSVIPLLLFHSASHIFQAVGDYEADLRGNVQTFVVRYGKKTSVKVGELLLVTSAFLPIPYVFLNLSLVDYLNWYIVIFICCVPGIFYVMKLLRNSSNDNINSLRHLFRKASSPILLIVWIYVYLIKISLS